MASNGKQVSMRDVSPGAAGVSLAAVSHGVNGGPVDAYAQSAVTSSDIYVGQDRRVGGIP